MSTVIDGSAGITTNAGGSVNPSTNIDGINYSCRAWVNFNGTGTPAIRASGNVTNITDNGTGDYTVNFTSAMSDSSFSGVAISHTTVTVINPNYSAVAGSIRLTTTNYSGTPTDSTIVDAAIFR